jgi:hypothetical protein
MSIGIPEPIYIEPWTHTYTNNPDMIQHIYNLLGRHKDITHLSIVLKTYTIRCVYKKVIRVRINMFDANNETNGKYIVEVQRMRGCSLTFNILYEEITKVISQKEIVLIPKKKCCISI